MNDIDARSVEAYGGFYAEYRLPWRAKWIRVRRDRVDQIYSSPFEAECMAWREMKSEVFGTILASGHKPINARSEAEKAFGSIFRKGRAVPVEYR